MQKPLILKLKKEYSIGILCILILISISFACTLVEPPETIYCFQYAQMIENLENLTYDERSDQYTAASTQISVQLNMEKASGSWYYLYLDYHAWDREDDIWNISLVDSRNKAVSEQKVILHEGTNELILPVQKFYSIRLESESMAGELFRLENVELRSQGKDFLVKKFLAVFVLTFIVLTVIVEIICRKRPMDRYVALIQESGEHMDAFLKVLGETVSWHFSQNVKHLLRSVIFLVMLLYMTYFQIQGTSVMQKYTSMHMWVMGGMLLVLAGLCFEDRKSERDESLLRYVTYLFIALILVSDFYMVKKYRYVGFGMLFMGGFFEKAWRTMEHPDKLAEEFKLAYKVYFVIGVISCIVARPLTVGICYNGFLSDTVSFGSAMLVAAAVFLDDFIRDNKKIFNEIGAFTALYLVWKTQQLTLILIAGLLLLAGVWFWILRWIKQDMRSKRKSIFISVCGAAAGMISIVFLQMMLYRVPFLLGTQKNYAADITETLDIAILDAIRICGWKRYFLDKVLDCKVYLQNINFMGHKTFLKIHNVSKWADNSIVMNLYWYGMAAGISYGIMTVLYFVKAVIMSLKRSEFLMLGLPLLSIAVCMTEAMEAPFMNLTWYFFYFGLCYILAQERQQ